MSNCPCKTYCKLTLILTASSNNHTHCFGLKRVSATPPTAQCTYCTVQYRGSPENLLNKKRALHSYYQKKLIENYVFMEKPLKQKSLLRYFVRHFWFFKQIFISFSKTGSFNKKRSDH
jgi:hypothetical protein